MPRKPQMNYYASLGGYYTQIKRVRYELAKGEEGDPDVKAKAKKEYRRLMYMDALDETDDGHRLIAICQKFLEHSHNTKANGTVHQRNMVIQAFNRKFANLPAKDLTEGMVQDWLEEMKQPRLNKKGRTVCWGTGMCRIALSVIKTCL